MVMEMAARGRWPTGAARKRPETAAGGDTHGRRAVSRPSSPGAPCSHCTTVTGRERPIWSKISMISEAVPARSK